VIDCGCCGGSHATAAEVRACCQGATLPFASSAERGPIDEQGALFDPPAPARRTSAAAVRPTRGDNVVVGPGQPAPSGFAPAERVVIDDAVLAEPRDTIDRLHAMWASRTPTVIELTTDLSDDPAETVDGPVWRLTPDFDFPLERLHHLVWSNSVDARSGEVATTADSPIDGGPLPSPADAISVVNAEHGDKRALQAATSSAELAPDQLEAVQHLGGPARIIAPAGSGKTRALTERARLLLDGWGVTPDALCLVAFNTRAADEMRDRTADLPGLRVRTLNSLGLAIVNGTGEFAGSGSPTTGHRQVIDEPGVRRIVSELVELPRRTNTDPVAPWIEALTQVRLGLRSPDAVEKEYGGDLAGFTEVFERYCQRLDDERLLDFDHQIYGAIERLCRDPVLRRHAQRACRVLLVDEFQDLTPAHLLFIRLLASPRYDVYGVGDDDQTIYGYNGADPAWLIDFDQYFPGATHHALEVNYRCPPTVVASAANLLSYNRRRVDKAIHPRPGRQAEEGELVVEISDDPTSGVLARVTELLDWGVIPTDIAVLARVNASLAPVQVALRSHGIANTAPIGAEFLERTGVRAALAWMAVASDPTHLRDRDIRETARRPSHGLSPKVVDWMTEHNSIDDIVRLAARLKDRDADKVSDWIADASLVAQHRESDTSDQLLRRIRDEIGLTRATDTLDRSRRKVDRSSHGDDLDALEQLGRLEPDPTRFAGWLRSNLESADGDPHGVRLSTIHRVKGQQWPQVIVYAVNDGLMPHRLSDDTEEERRVFHVAITRTVDRCLVVADERRPSLFLAELNREAPEPVPARGTAPGEMGGEKREKVELAAYVGLEFDHGGYTVTVSGIDDASVTVTAGRATMTVPFGARVRHDGHSIALAPPDPSARPTSIAAGAVLSAGDQSLRDQLREWRKRKAAESEVPAFVIFNDKTLDELVARRPTDEAALLACRGIGSFKVENYGDEILAVILADSD
jgi:DNA helicase-2/ATP-dependent DNA helicase PcrA